MKGGIRVTKQTYHSGEDPAAMEQLSTRRLEELLLQALQEAFPAREA